MQITIIAGGRKVSVEVRDVRSVPDMLKLCKALGLEPSEWHVDGDSYHRNGRG